MGEIKQLFYFLLTLLIWDSSMVTLIHLFGCCIVSYCKKILLFMCPLMDRQFFHFFSNVPIFFFTVANSGRMSILAYVWICPGCIPGSGIAGSGGMYILHFFSAS